MEPIIRLKMDHPPIQSLSPIKKEMSTVEIKKVAIQVIQQNPLSNPFPIIFNPHAILAEQQTIEWMKKFHLLPDSFYEKFKSAKFIDLTSGAYPHCEPERLALIDQWIVFLYLNDDIVEKKDSKSLKNWNERHMQVLCHTQQLQIGDQPLTYALENLMRRIEKVANKNWIDRFLKKVQQHFESTIWEAQNREKNIHIPDYEIYLKKRLDTGGVYTVLPFIEIAEQIQIPDEIFEKYLMPLETCCNNIICFSNDVKSCPKELEDEFMNNLVFVSQIKLNCSLENAIQYAIDLHNKEVKKFEKLKDDLYAKFCDQTIDLELKKYEKELRSYVEGMRYWMGSHFDFAQKSKRYN